MLVKINKIKVKTKEDKKSDIKKEVDKRQCRMTMQKMSKTKWIKNVSLMLLSCYFKNKL